MYMSKFAPRAGRGKITALAVAYGFWGFALVPFIGLWLIPLYSFGWRITFIIGGLGGLVTLWLRRHIPPSLRWLIMQDHLDEADLLVTQLEKTAEKKLGKPLPKPREDLQAMPAKKQSFFDLFHPPFFKITVCF